MGIYRVFPAWFWTREMEVDFGPIPLLPCGCLLPPLSTPACSMPITPSWTSQLNNVPH